MNNFGVLCSFLKKNAFKVVMVEGPRGIGKTTLCGQLIEALDLAYYKTWGDEQRTVRGDMQSRLGLDLPQGTYFVLDLARQVSFSRPIIADRCNLSALVYQRDTKYGTNAELHSYYASLMRESRSVILALTGPEDVIVDRRVGRGVNDEFRLYEVEGAAALLEVRRDSQLYKEALCRMSYAGVEAVAIFELDDGVCCWAYVAKGLEYELPVEMIHDG